MRLEDLIVGDSLLAVIPESSELQPVKFVEFRAGTATTRPIEVALEPAVLWKVRVTGPEGAPVAGSRVELMRRVGRGPAPKEARTLHDAFVRGIWGTYMAVSTSEAITDEAGVATLRTAADVTGCALRVRGASHRDTRVELFGPVAAAEVRDVTVEVAARLRGQLGPPELVARFGPTAVQRAVASVYLDTEKSLEGWRMYVKLVSRVEGRLRHSATAYTDDGGRFAFDGLPPGDYELSVRLPGSGTTGDLGKVLGLTAGELRDLNCDLGTVVPVRIRGQVLLNGNEPPTGSELTLGGRRYPMDDRGRFEADVSPGKRQASLWVRRHHAPSSTFRYPEELAVGPAGGETEVTLAFQRRRFEFTVTDLAGEPVAAKWIVVRRDDAGQTGDRISTVLLDRDGRGHFESEAPAVHLTLWFDPPQFSYVEKQPEHHVDLGRVEIAAGKTEASFEFAVDGDNGR